MDPKGEPMSLPKSVGGTHNNVLPPKLPANIGGNTAKYESNSMGGMKVTGGAKKGSRAMKMKMARLRAMRKTRGGRSHKYGGNKPAYGGNKPSTEMHGGEDSMSTESEKPPTEMQGGAIESALLKDAYGSVKPTMPMHAQTMKGGKKRRGSRKGSKKNKRR